MGQALDTFWTRDQRPEWGRPTISSYGGEINHWYYTVQALFNADAKGRGFRTYYHAMKQSLVQHQHPDGRWDCFSPNGLKQGPDYTTSLAALSLMVVYRNLPTTQSENHSPLILENDPIGEEDGIQIKL